MRFWYYIRFLKKNKKELSPIPLIQKPLNPIPITLLLDSILNSLIKKNLANEHIKVNPSIELIISKINSFLDYYLNIW